MKESEFIEGLCRIDQRFLSKKLEQQLNEVQSSQRTIAYVKWLQSWPWESQDTQITEVLDPTSIVPLKGPSDSSTQNWEVPHVLHIRKVLRLVDKLSKFVDHYLGRYLKRLGREKIDAICNMAETQKVMNCKTLAQECGCPQCLRFCTVTTTPKPSTCLVVQFLTNMMSKTYTNFTGTYLRQCVSLAEKTDFYSPLLRSPASSNDVRLMVESTKVLESVKDDLEKGRVRLPIVYAGTDPTFVVSNSITNHLQAITYTDGDGGFITADYVPGILNYSRLHAVTSHTIAVGMERHTLIPFREAFHDAVELGHIYVYRMYLYSDGTSQARTEYEAGLQALGLARRAIGNSKTTIIRGVGVDTFGRLLVEISTIAHEDENPSANGLRALEKGVSFYVNLSSVNVPECYRHAQERAQHMNEGVWMRTFENLVSKPELMPWSLKRSLALNQTFSIDHEFDVEDEDEIESIRLEVTNNADNLNESNVYVAKSSIPGAGLGLYIRPPASGSITIPSGKHICRYDKENKDNADESSDYYLKQIVGRREFVFDAREINGLNMGRFVNQGGLTESLQHACRDASVQPIRWKDIREFTALYTNVRFRVSRNNSYIVTTKEITLNAGDAAVELLVDYRIYDYWLPYVLRNYQQLPSNCALVQSVFWLLLSSNSHLDKTERSSFLAGYPLSDEIKDNYRNMQCPFPIETRRRPRYQQCSSCGTGYS
jgi:endonuclease YncB( thermonuclease family)